MRIVNTDQAPKPGGHYSQAIQSGSLLFISGQLPITPEGHKLTGDIRQQIHQVLENIIAITIAAGGQITSLIKTTVYIADMSYWPIVNEIYQQKFGDHRPARAIVPVTELHYGFGVEIEAVAELSK